MANRDVLWQWAVIWPEAVDALPSYYDPVKAAVIKEQNNQRLFSLKGFLKLKASGNLPLCDIKKYKLYLKRVSDVPVFIVYLISILGREEFLLWLYRIFIMRKKVGGK